MISATFQSGPAPFGCSRLIVTSWISLPPRVRLAIFKHSASSQALLLVRFSCSFFFASWTKGWETWECDEFPRARTSFERALHLKTMRTDRSLLVPSFLYIWNETLQRRLGRLFVVRFGRRPLWLFRWGGVNLRPRAYRRARRLRALSAQRRYGRRSRHRLRSCLAHTECVEGPDRRLARNR
jgi:hypothetical protein